MSKDTILQALRTLPAEVTIDDVVERLIFIERVEEGLRDSEAGRTVSQEDVKKMVASWSK